MKHTSTAPRIVLAAFAAFLLFLAGCGKDRGINTGPGTGSGTITSVNDIINATNRLDLVGRSVDISDAFVEGSAVGFYIFLAGVRHQVIPVARQDKYDAERQGRTVTPVTAGRRVRIVGTVRLIETTSATDWMWRSINAAERRDIEAQRVYILATAVTLIN